VERDALNFFEPFERLPPNHENQLTRALLVVLRLSPVTHAAWLARAVPGRRLHELPIAVFNTQRRAVREDSGAEDQVPVISVFLAPNQPLGEDVIVKESDRLQVLDAVIEYGDALVMVVENKVAEASDAQARELNITGSGVVIAPGQERQVVTWPEVIGDITGIVERGLAGGAERSLCGRRRSQHARTSTRVSRALSRQDTCGIHPRRESDRLWLRETGIPESGRNDLRRGLALDLGRSQH
jgi:hypothetical protein